MGRTKKENEVIKSCIMDWWIETEELSIWGIGVKGVGEAVVYACCSALSLCLWQEGKSSSFTLWVYFNRRPFEWESSKLKETWISAAFLKYRNQSTVRKQIGLQMLSEWDNTSSKQYRDSNTAAHCHSDKEDVSKEEYHFLFLSWSVLQIMEPGLQNTGKDRTTLAASTQVVTWLQDHWACRAVLCTHVGILLQIARTGQSI